MKESPVTTYGAVILAVTSWGLSFIGAKLVLQCFPIFTYIFIRFALAARLVACADHQTEYRD